jgi:hypothetical protein
MCGLALVRSFGNIPEDTSLTLPEPADYFDQYPRRTMHARNMYSKNVNHVTKLLSFLRKPLVPGMGNCYLPSIRGFKSFPRSPKVLKVVFIYIEGKKESTLMGTVENWPLPAIRDSLDDVVVRTNTKHQQYRNELMSCAE